MPYTLAARKARRRIAVAKYQLAHRERRAAAHQRVRTDLRALKLLRGCIDCGYDENADALEFDHVRGKKLKNLASLALSTNRLVAELAKCEVRCANCHRIVTQSRVKAA